jgi:outer membrane protein
VLFLVYGVLILLENRFAPVALSAVLLLAGQGAAGAQEARDPLGWIRGDWYLTVGAAGFAAPSYEGAKDFLFSASPMISLSKAGVTSRFSSRNDNISFALFDAGSFSAGPTGQFIFKRDGDTDSDLKGLAPIPFGGELGAFAQFYPTDWLRVRAELRQGIVSYDGTVADVAADAFHDVTPTVRVSGGPRFSAASSGYFEAYYGVNAKESAASGLSEYSPGGGVKSVGVGGAINWQTTEKVATSVFSEYSRLMGPAADSSLVKERGSPNQLMLGVSATYRFDFTL